MPRPPELARDDDSRLVRGMSFHGICWHAVEKMCKKNEGGACNSYAKKEHGNVRISVLRAERKGGATPRFQNLMVRLG